MSNERLTAAELEAIRGLTAAARYERLRMHRSGAESFCIDDCEMDMYPIAVFNGPSAEANCRFDYNMRRYVPRLLAEIDALEAERDRWRRIRTPSHGPCCTCQACGLDYEKCRCDLDEVADELDSVKAERDELLAQNAELQTLHLGYLTTIGNQAERLAELRGAAMKALASDTDKDGYSPRWRGILADALEGDY